MKTLFRFCLTLLVSGVMIVSCKSVDYVYQEDTAKLSAALQGTTGRAAILGEKPGPEDIRFDGNNTIIQADRGDSFDSKDSRFVIDWQGNVTRGNDSFPFLAEYNISNNDNKYIISIDIKKSPDMYVFERIEFRDYDYISQEKSSFVTKDAMPLEIAVFYINGKKFSVEITRFSTIGFSENPKAANLSLMSDKNQILFIKDSAGQPSAQFTAESYEIYASDQDPETLWPVIGLFNLIQEICRNKDAV